MSDLTEQWKKRTLPNGVYYIKLIGGDILPAFCNTEHILKQFQTMKGIYDGADIEVLAPVPTYEELQSLEADRPAKNEGEEIVAELKEENTRLKELLKECQKFFEEENQRSLISCFEMKYELLTKIEEVLK